ncbi:twin-arginine translocation signal domain-containing protein [Sphingobacterium multivorum]|nr:twin-arginine translocation signal domain-containing protein [Sphingobacterium multivorum]
MDTRRDFLKKAAMLAGEHLSPMLFHPLCEGDGY